MSPEDGARACSVPISKNMDSKRRRFGFHMEASVYSNFKLFIPMFVILETYCCFYENKSLNLIDVAVILSNNQLLEKINQYFSLLLVTFL